MEINFKLTNYEGPLDLLLVLIKSKKLKISEISIVDVVDQFITIINESEKLNLNDISEYLFLAAELVKIKAKYLLKMQDEKNFFDEDKSSVEDLVQRLLEYEKHKILSEQILHIFQNNPQIEKESNDFEEFVAENTIKNYVLLQNTSDDIKNAILRIFNTISERKPFNPKFHIKRISIEDRRKELEKLLQEHEEISFRKFFLKSHNIYLIVITFFCLLEMANANLIELSQIEEKNDLMIRRK